MKFLQHKITFSFTVISIIALISCIYASLIHKITPSVILNVIIFILIVNLCFLCMLKIYKSYRAAFAVGFLIAFTPIFFNIFPVSFFILFSLFLGLLSILIYTLADSTGLKHRQDISYIIFSLIIYTAAVILSLYVVLVPVVLLSYEIITKEEVGKVLKRLIPFTIVTIIAIILKISGITLMQ